MLDTYVRYYTNTSLGLEPWVHYGTAAALYLIIQLYKPEWSFLLK